MPSELLPEVGELAATPWHVVSCVAGSAEALEKTKGVQALWPLAPSQTAPGSFLLGPLRCTYLTWALLLAGFGTRDRGLTRSEVFPQAGVGGGGVRGGGGKTIVRTKKMS